MANILQLETSSNHCSVALSKDGHLLAYRQSEQEMNHMSIVTILIEECLKESGLKMQDLSAIAVSQGPGSYTGLRVGTSVAKGLAFGLEIPLIGVNTLAAIALEGYRLQPDADIIIPMIDARRMEVYAAIYDKKEVIKENFNIIIDELVFNTYLDSYNKVFAIGSGAPKTKSVLKNPSYLVQDLANSAKYLIPISHQKYEQQQFEDLNSFVPSYIKAPNITVPKSKFF